MPQEPDAALVSQIRDIFDNARSPKAALEEACRVIISTEEGIKRLIVEALQGDRDSWWKTVERGHGRTPQVIDVKGKLEHSIPVDGLSPKVLEVLALLDAARQKQAKVIDAEHTLMKRLASRGEPSTSDNVQSGNSAPRESSRYKPTF